MKRQITVANLIMWVGGIVTFLFSFFAFYDDDDFTSSSAWGDITAFVSTIPAVLGLAMAVWVSLELLGVKLPKSVLTYNTAQLKGTWGIAAAGIMLGWISANDAKGFGFWMMLLGSVAMGVGAILGLLGKGTDLVDLPDIPGVDLPHFGHATPQAPVTKVPPAAEFPTAPAATVEPPAQAPEPPVQAAEPAPARSSVFDPQPTQAPPARPSVFDPLPSDAPPARPSVFDTPAPPTPPTPPVPPAPTPPPPPPAPSSPPPPPPPPAPSSPPPPPPPPSA